MLHLYITIANRISKPIVKTEIREREGEERCQEIWDSLSSTSAGFIGR